MSQNKQLLNIEEFLEIKSNCNIYWTDLNHKIINCNDCMLAMFRQLYHLKNYETILNKYPTDFLLPDAAQIVMDENNMVMKSGKPHQFLNKAVLNGNQNVVMLTLKVPTHDVNGKINGVFGISHILSAYNIEDNTIESLTTRESDCLMLLVKGKTAAQIGQQLKLSTRTVEFYLGNIKSKLGCKSKSDLIDRIYALGLATLSVKTTSEPFKSGVFLPDIDNDNET